MFKILNFFTSTMLIFLITATGISGSYKVYHVAQNHIDANDANPGTESLPWKTISRAAETAVAGDTILIHEGIYREEIFLKNSGSDPARMITFAGALAEKPIVKGSIIIKGWHRQGRLWTAPWPYPQERFRGFRDSFRYRSEQVFWNENLLFHVPTLDFLEAFTKEAGILKGLLTTESEAMNIYSDSDTSELLAVINRFYADGAFWIDYGNEQIYIKLPDGADPNNHIIEASIQPYFINGEKTKFIRLRNLVFRHCSQWHFQYGAITAGYGWILEDLDVGYSAGRGVTISGAELIQRVKAHHHGALGFGGSAMMVQDCETSDNNYKGGGWLTLENGGWKAVFADGMFVRRHVSSRNFGPGIWLDIDNRNSVITQSIVQDNTGAGIFIEISGIGGITITNNLCVGNGLAPFAFWGDAGITLAESESCVVQNNICVGNNEGLAIRMQGPREFDVQNGQSTRLVYYTHDHTICYNIFAFNRDRQLSFWGDNPFFGPHPSAEVNVQEQQTGKPLLDPEKLNLVIDHNLYFTESGQGLIQYGAIWRPKSESYKNLVEWQNAHSFDANSLFADPMFNDWRSDDFGLNQGSPAQKAGMGLSLPPLPRWDVNKDGIVDLYDLILVGENLNQTGKEVTGDVNVDDIVDILDLTLVSVHLGETYLLDIIGNKIR